MFLVRAFAVWLVLMTVEVVHGISRTLLLAPPWATSGLARSVCSSVPC